MDCLCSRAKLVLLHKALLLYLIYPALKRYGLRLYKTVKYPLRIQLYSATEQLI